MKQTEKLQQQLNDGLTLVIDNTRRAKYSVQDENGNIVIDWQVYFKGIKSECVNMGLLK